MLSIRPPHLNGPHFHLVLKDGVLSGAVSGSTAPAGNMRVHISRDGAEGYGPAGPVAMDFVVTEDATVAEGMWNGSRVHLVFSRDSLKGTVADNSDLMARSDPDSRLGTLIPRNRRGRAVLPYANSIDPIPQNTSCEYFLNQVASDGALTGGSICSGMPQQTRLEVPKQAETYLTRPELVTILVAVLAAPPAPASEEMGPRFDSNPADATVPPLLRRR